MTYYDDLEVSQNSSLDDIKKSYRRLAMQYHPDKHQEEEAKKTANEKFQQIAAAYETLSDADKRKKYDLKLSGHDDHPQHPPFAGQGHPFANFFQGGFPFDLNQMFSHMNIQFNRAKQKLKEESHTIHIGIDDVFDGFDKHLKKSTPCLCEKCYKTCDDCKGQGFIMQPMNNGFIRQVQQMQCHRCKGKGMSLHKHSNCDCDASGMKQKVFDIHFHVPANKVLNVSINFENMGAQPMQFLETPGDFRVHLDIKKPKEVDIDKSTGTITYRQRCTVQDLVCGTTFQLPGYLRCSDSITFPPLESLKPTFRVTKAGHGFIVPDGDSKANLIIIPEVDYESIDTSKVDISLLKQAFGMQQA